MLTWRDAAVADGWLLAGGHPNYWILTKGEWIAHVTPADVYVWGPDRLAVQPPAEYNWDALVRGLRVCKPCGATDVDTQRYSFAGRCCASCRPKMSRKYEQPGWCD